jgi:hypothetical protein
MDRPAWKRKPWRFTDDGRSFELEVEPGVWRRVEDREPVECRAVLHFDDNGFGDPTDRGHALPPNRPEQCAESQP